MSNRYADANLKIFSLNSNPELAKEIADRIGVDVGKSSVKRFSDGEVQINIEESIRGCDCYVIQSTSAPVNEHIMESSHYGRCTKTRFCENGQYCDPLLRICTSRS